MATTTYGSPYAQSADLVSAWPATSLTVADRIDDVSFKGNGLNNQTASYTGVLLDAGKTVMMNVATANTFTIPASGSIAYELGTVLRISNKGAGTTTVQPNGGVTLNGGNISLTQYQSCEVQLVATDIWVATVKPQTVTASGLTLITTSTFSAAASVSVNNCFSATYANYLIVVSGTNTTENLILFRMRNAGVDATAANYSQQNVNIADSVFSADRQTGQTSARAGLLSTAFGGFTTMFFNPFASTITMTKAEVADPTGGARFLNYTCQHGVASSYDGVTLYPASGNMTGTVRVYGYQNS